MTTEATPIQMDPLPAGFPTQNSAIFPETGHGMCMLSLAGSPGATQIYLHFDSAGTGGQVFYAQNYRYPNTPLPQGTTTYPLAPGFQLRWQAADSPFKLMWGVA